MLKEKTPAFIPIAFKEEFLCRKNVFAGKINLGTFLKTI